MLIEKAGAFSLVLECITPKTSKIITQNLKYLPLELDLLHHCDGQILVTDDMLGLSGFYPKFVKNMLDLIEVIEKAVKKYSKEVKFDKISFK